MSKSKINRKTQLYFFSFIYNELKNNYIYYIFVLKINFKKMKQKIEIDNYIYYILIFIIN